MKFRIVHPYCAKPEVEFIPDKYCPNDRAFLLAPNQTPFQYLRSVQQAEKEKNEWIRKYENVLKGLNYWQNKFKEMED